MSGAEEEEEVAAASTATVTKKKQLVVKPGNMIQHVEVFIHIDFNQNQRGNWLSAPNR